jgi:hypothetical protein
VRSEPQRDWNSFSPAVTIPKDVEETILSPTEETRSSRGTTETEKFIQKREMDKSLLLQTTAASEEGQAEKERGDHEG